MVIVRVLHLWEISDFFALKKMQRINLKYTESEVKNFGQYYKAGHSVKQVAKHFNIKYRDALHYLIYFGYYIPTRKLVDESCLTAICSPLLLSLMESFMLQKAIEIPKMSISIKENLYLSSRANVFLLPLQILLIESFLLSLSYIIVWL